MKSEVVKRKVDIPDELLARILDAAAGINRHEHQRQTRDLCTRVTKCIKVDSDFRIYIVNCKKLSFLSSTYHLNIKLKLKLKLN